VSHLQRFDGAGYPGLYGPVGFVDAVDPVPGAVGHRDLVLDQSMIMAAPFGITTTSRDGRGQMGLPDRAEEAWPSTRSETALDPVRCSVLTNTEQKAIDGHQAGNGQQQRLKNQGAAPTRQAGLGCQMMCSAAGRAWDDTGCAYFAHARGPGRACRC
jgi:hypothetical protein